MEETRCLEIDFQIRLLKDADFENMSAFFCNVRALDDFFHDEMKECVDRHYLSAYCAYLPSGEIIAAFTLMNDALMIVSQTEKEDFIEDLRLETNHNTVDFLNRQSSYPAVNIGHLGVAEKFQRRGIGSAIIDLVVDTFSKHRQTGCQFITVDALNNPGALRFYCKNAFGYQIMRDQYSPTRRMYRFF